MSSNRLAHIKCQETQLGTLLPIPRITKIFKDSLNSTFRSKQDFLTLKQSIFPKASVFLKDSKLQLIAGVVH